MNSPQFFVSWGGIGDVLVVTPTLHALKRQHPRRPLVVICPRRSHLDLLRHNPDIACAFYLPPLLLKLGGALFAVARIPVHSLWFQRIPPDWIYEITTKEIMADMLGVQLADRRIRIHLTDAEKAAGRDFVAGFEKPVVMMHIHSHSSPNHHWPLARWEELVASLPEYQFVQIGLPTEPAVAGALDLRGRTTLRRAFSIIGHAASFVGVESSMAHVTNAFAIPGVVLFGDSSPVFWGHENNVNIYKNVSCSPCYDLLCGRAKCPYGHECMELITVAEVRDALVGQISRRDLRDATCAAAEGAEYKS